MIHITSKSQTFPYLYRGIVKLNDDPKSIGRCKIHIPDLYGNDDYNINLLPWARPITLSPYTGDRGSFNIPDVGDIVWVFLEGGNKSAPVYFGGTVSVRDSLVDTSLVKLYQEGESILYYHRETQDFVLKSADTSLTISPDGVYLHGNFYTSGGVVPWSKYDIIEEVDDVYT